MTGDFGPLTPTVWKFGVEVGAGTEEEWDVGAIVGGVSMRMLVVVLLGIDVSVRIPVIVDLVDDGGFSLWFGDHQWLIF